MLLPERSEKRRGKGSERTRPSTRPQLECLEDRTAPAVITNWTYTGSGAGAWSDSNNWSNGVPSTSGYIANFPANARGTCLVDQNEECGQITASASTSTPMLLLLSGNLKVDTGGTFSDSTMTIADWVTSSGTFEIGGGTFTWTAGSFNNGNSVGLVQVDTGATFNVKQAAATFQRPLTVQASATVTFDTTNDVNMDGSTVNNSGTINLVEGSSSGWSAPNNDWAVVNNSGTILKTSDNTNSVTLAAYINNKAAGSRLEVAAGSLTISGAGGTGNSIDQSAGVIQLDNGTTLNANYDCALTGGVFKVPANGTFGGGHLSFSNARLDLTNGASSYGYLEVTSIGPVAIGFSAGSELDVSIFGNNGGCGEVVTDNSNIGIYAFNTTLNVTTIGAVTVRMPSIFMRAQGGGNTITNAFATINTGGLWNAVRNADNTIYQLAPTGGGGAAPLLAEANTTATGGQGPTMTDWPLPTDLAFYTGLLLSKKGSSGEVGV